MRNHRRVSIGVAILAIVQGLFGVFRGFDYIDIGEKDLAGQGLFLQPLMGLVEYSRGVVIILATLLSFIFAAGILLGKNSVWWFGFAAAILNILLVLGLLIDGEHIAELLLWLLVPLLVLWFLFSRFGSQPGIGSDEGAGG